MAAEAAEELGAAVERDAAMVALWRAAGTVRPVWIEIVKEGRLPA
jgi:hypothetical protein